MWMWFIVFVVLLIWNMKGEEVSLLPGPSSSKVYSTKDSNNSDSDSSSESLSIKLGSIKIPLYGTNSSIKAIPAEERIKYTWREINTFANTEKSRRRVTFFKRTFNQVDHRKHILKNVNGIAYPNELLAILGSSGAGKTTLLNALTYRTTKNVVVSGTRCVNGIPVNSKSLTSVSGYVQQDDLFIPTLTVKEHLIFQALVRMDRHLRYRERIKRVEDVLVELGLKKCENTVIGQTGIIKGISGGEKKRLSFAAEVLTNPSLMFCDEPTSGLDSFMALNVIQVLKTMAQNGKTVLCTIHQPSSELYALFDKLLLLAEGRVAFLGTPEEAQVFFADLEAPCPKNYNPADYFIQLLAIVPGQEESCRHAINLICNQYESSETGAKMLFETLSTEIDYGNEVWFAENSKRSPYKASWLAQFRAVLWRSWLSIMKNPLLVKARITQTVIISLIIGAIYYGQKIDQDGVVNINGVLFIFLTNMTFQNVFAVINVFCQELPIFLREHRNGMYRTDAYFLGKTLAELPLFTVLPIIFLSICYYMIGLNQTPVKFFIACAIIILVTNVAISFGYMISCASTTVSMALSLGPPLIIPFLLFGGFFLNVSSIPKYLRWLSHLSWFRYGNEALLINQWENVNHIDCQVNNSTCIRNGRMILEYYNFFETDFISDIVGLASLIMAFRLVAYMALLWKAYQRN